MLLNRNSLIFCTLGGILLFNQSAWSQTCSADINSDGLVDGKDLAIVLSQWGKCSGTGCGAGGDCCEPEGGSAGCNDVECCSRICAWDPFCCNSSWDSQCASAARINCAVCLADCPLPAFTSQEQEPCGSDSNGGCSIGGGYELVAALPASIKGSFWADGDTRDTDWYEVTITQPSTISMSVYSTMPCFAALVDPACKLIGSISSGSCPSSGGVCVIPGTYWVAAIPQPFNGFPCGSGEVNDYVLEIVAAPCDAGPPG